MADPLADFIKKWKREAEGYVRGSMFKSPVGDMNRASAQVVRTMLSELAEVAAVRGASPAVKAAVDDAEGWLRRMFDYEVQGCNLTIFEDEAAQIIKQLLLCVADPQSAVRGAERTKEQLIAQAADLLRRAPVPEGHPWIDEAVAWLRQPEVPGTTSAVMAVRGAERCTN